MRGNWASSSPLPQSQTKKACTVSARAKGGHFASKCLQLPVQRALTRLAGLQRDILLPNKHNILLLFKSSLCQCPLASHGITGVSIYAYSSSLINSLPFSVLRNTPLPPVSLSPKTDPSPERTGPLPSTSTPSHPGKYKKLMARFLRQQHCLLLHNLTPCRNKHLDRCII